MGQQTSTADRPPAVAGRRVAPSVLAAVAAIVALLGATGMVWWTSLSGRHITSGAQADQVFADSVNVFDAEAGASPAVQVSTATLTNVGTSAVKVKAVTFSPDPPPSIGGEGFDATGGDSSDAPPPIPFDIFPGENCVGATIQPKQDCMVSVRYTIPQTEFHGSLIFTMDDGSQAFSDLGANLRQLNSILADPYVVDFGTRPVGTTSAPRTVTISASPDDTDYEIVAVSVVDTVPTPGDKADYAISSDGCTSVDLQLPEVIEAQPHQVSPFTTDPTVPGGGGTGSDGPTGPFGSCQIQVTDTPGGSGPRPAFLNVSYCQAENSEFSGPSLQFGQQDLSGASDDPTTDPTGTPTTTSTPPPPPDPNIFCPNGDNATSFHQLVALNGAGQATTTTPPPTTPVTTTPVTTTTPPPTTTTPPVTVPPQIFTPTLIATPPLSPAGRTTQVSGTGFPTNTPVVFALVALGTAPDANISGVPAVVRTGTDGNGDFSNQVMLIMPHLPPGQYEILAQAQIGKTPVTATVPFLVAPGSQQPPKFASRH